MIDRRAFLKTGSIALFTAGVGPSFLGRAALAATEPGPFKRRKALVTIFQRGAMDALAAVAPITGSGLAKLRPRLAMSAARSAGDEAVADLGVGFGLHPAFGDLLPLWKDRRLAIVHAVGSPDPTRSHFDAQDYMETGTPGRKGTPDGWLNRVVGELGHDGRGKARLRRDTPFRAVSMTAALPRSLYGPHSALAVTDLRDFRVSLPGAPSAGQAAGQGFEALYEETSQDLLRSTAQETFEALDVLEKLDVTRYRPAPSVSYPRSPLGRSLRQIAFLIKSDVGLEVAFAESGGWDTHVQQGTTKGSFARRAADLARSIAAFWQDLGTYQDDVVVMTMTEFGRTVRENGSGGTDHGHGSCLFAIGNRMDGGKVHGDFASPSALIAASNLYEGRDLSVTTDFRAVFSAVAGSHLAIGRSDKLFPGWKGRPLPLLRRA